MFERDFYPTPHEVIIQMIENVDFTNKTVFEPSAGKGNIVKVLKERGANSFDGKMRTSYHSDRCDVMNDVYKALCHLTGTNYDSELEFSNFITNYQKTENEFERRQPMYRDWGVWYDWTFFRVKWFKKGTLHCEFKDEKVWEMFNRKVAEIQGWRLPETTKHFYRSKSNEVSIF